MRELMKSFTLILALFSLFSISTSAPGLVLGLVLGPPQATHPRPRPRELSLVMMSLNRQKLHEGEKKILQRKTKVLDQCLNALKKEELFFLVRAEIYKGILEYRKGESTAKTKIDKREIEKSIANPAYSPISRWLIKAALTDLRLLSSSPRGKKKLSLIMPWPHHFSRVSPEEFEWGLKDLSFRLLENITIACQEFVKYTRLKESNSK